MKCELEGTKVYYEVFGQGRPIMMLHGWSLDHRHMVNALEPLFTHRDGWKRIYLDLPGHGRTAGRSWITNQDRVLDVVVDFIDNVIPGQRFVAAGCSAGTCVARGLVHRRAALMDGLLLTVPLIVPDDAQRAVPAHVTLVEDPELIGDLDPGEADALQIAVVRSRMLIERLRMSFPSEEKSGDQEFQASIRERPENYGFSFDVDALPETFGGPTLIVAGRQDAIVGYRDAWRILENYPRGTFVVLDRAGHLLEIEQENLFHTLASEWLDRVEEYAGTAG